MRSRRVASAVLAAVIITCGLRAAEPPAPKDNGAAVAQDKPMPEIKPGMRIKSVYAGALYPGVLVEVKDKNTYVIRSDGYKTDSTVDASRLQTEDGIEFLDIVKDPQRMAQRERDKLQGDAYFIGLWNTSNNPVILTSRSEPRPDGTVTVTKEVNLNLVKGWLQVKDDGTYQHRMYGGDKVEGQWARHPEKKDAIVLKKAHLTGGDLTATRQPLGTVLLQGELGGAGYTGTIINATPVDGEARKK